MKRSAAIVFFFSLACVFFMPLYAEIPDGRQALKEIDVVMDDNYPPYTFRDSTGQLRGILVDEWRLWQEKTGIRVKLKGMDWDKAQTAVKEGRAQVIDTLFFSEERAGSFDFSVPYHEIGVSVFFNRDISGITGIDTLQGFTIGVKSGDACIGMLKKQGISALQEYPNYESIVRAASEKKVKVFCIDNPPALYFLYRMNLEGDFRHTAPLYTGRFHRAVQRGRRDILAAVEKGFAAISPGEYEAIEKKWLGYAIAELPYIRYASYALALLFFLGLTALLWNHLLRRQVARKTAQIEAMLKDLQESGEKLRTLSDNIAGGLVYRLEEDEEGRERRFSYISAGVRQLHEVDISESLNDPMTLYGQVLDEDRPLLAAREEAAKNSMSALSAEVRIRVPSGGIKWVTINSTPRRLSGGSLVWDGIEVDITDRKRAEEALVESYSILKSVLESPRNVVIFALDRQYRYIAFNENHRRTMKEIWGADIAIGKSMLEYISDSGDNVKARGNFDRALSGESFTIIEEYGDTALSRKYYEDVYNPITDDSGNITGLTLYLSDISDRKRSEAEQQRLQEQLVQAHKMESIGRLAGGVAHDFNNMLSVIIGYSEFAMRDLEAASDEKNERLYSRLREILKAARRSADLTHQLLAFASKQTVIPRILDLNEATEDVLVMLRRLIGENINLVWMPDSGIMPIYMDPSQLDQILTNICVNARDAIEGTGKIIIETRSARPDERFLSSHPEAIKDDYVMLSVRDNGAGMDSETRERLFEPFFTTKEKGKGTGLGLSTIYGIVRQNGGFIDVESSPGEGTTFRIYLPGHRAGSDPVRRESPSVSSFEGHETILLVEDEPAILKLEAQMLESLGYMVLSASTPGVALRLVREHAGRIDLLMSDVIMPHMNGHELARSVATLKPGIRCLLVSGYTDDIIASENIREEGFHFMQKPFSMRELASGVRQALDGASWRGR